MGWAILAGKRMWMVRPENSAHVQSGLAAPSRVRPNLFSGDKGFFPLRAGVALRTEGLSRRLKPRCSRMGLMAGVKSGPISEATG